MDVTPTPPTRLVVAGGDAGRTLLEIAAEALESWPLAALLIARGGLWVDGARVRDGSSPAPAGSTLTLRRPPGGGYLDPRLDAAWVIYEDEDLVALDKPPGAYSTETPWDAEGNVHAALARFLRERDGDTPPLHPAHRLDRDTSGVLLFSKNPAVNRPLQRTFAEGGAHKTYRCLCAGEPAEDAWAIETGHGRSAHGRFRVYPLHEVGRELPGGSRVKQMRTRFVVVARLGDAALLEAFPETGRTHQIRLHLAHAGHPLVGDVKYGGSARWREAPLDHHLLHAARLELPHPRTGAPLAIAAPLPRWAARPF